MNILRRICGHIGKKKIQRDYILADDVDTNRGNN